MELKDLIVFPLFLLILLIAFHVWQIRSGNTGSRWKYALLFKVFGAVFIGLLYQFYYGGGDTFNFYYHSKQIWLAILDHPVQGISMLFNHGKYYPEISEYISKMWWFRDESSMMVSRVSAFFGIFSFHSYLGISLFFSFFSFLASMALYRVFSDIKPENERIIFTICFFIPSVAVWGSGLFKDTIAFVSSAAIVYSFYFIFLKKQFSFFKLAILLLAFYFLYIIKIYILISLLPGLIIWLITANLSNIRSKVLKFMLAPLFLSSALAAGYFMINQVTLENERYSLSNISKTAQITAMDIYAGWGAGSGSAYYLGEQDGSIGNFISLIPEAIIVTLFRPWPWEINSPIMVLSALESLFFLIFTVYILFKTKIFGFFKIAISSPEIVFCLVFSLTLAIGVGIASYNFGTLSRYKIPLLPFYLMALMLIYSKYREIRQKA